MVDRYPNQPQGEGDEPFFADPEFQRRWDRIEKISVAHGFLATAFELDDRLAESGVTKSFVSRTTGNRTYPFYHVRTKLKPKNRVHTDIGVAVLRFPSAAGFQGVGTDCLYLAYEDSAGEHKLYLSADQFSILDPKLAFQEPGEGGVFPPNADGLYAATERDILALDSILGVDSDFEPDLQVHEPDVSA